MGLTMRMVDELIQRMHIRNTTKEYYRSKLLTSVHGLEIPTLEEILGIKSEEATDDKKNAQMEKMALDMLERQRKKATQEPHG